MKSDAGSRFDAVEFDRGEVPVPLTFRKERKMNRPFDPVPAAALLVSHWRSGARLAELPAAVRPRDLNNGYDVQDRFVAETGEAVSGWKLGVGSPAAMKSAGLNRPLIGRLFASRCHRSGDTARLPDSAPVTVEFEVAFILGRDIAPDDTLVAPLDVVSSTHAAFELVRSRFIDRRAVGWPSFVADNVGFEASILGDAIDPSRIGAVIDTVVVSVDGEEKAKALAGDDLTDPIKSLGYLMEHARERGVTLRKGDIVTTGAIGKPFDIAGGNAEIVASFVGSTLRVRTQVR